MSGPLAQRLQACGPVVDPKAAERARSAFDFEVLPNVARAWEALRPVFAAAPYLETLARRDPSRLERLLAADPEASLAGVLAAPGAVAARRAGLDDARRGLRLAKAELHLLCALCDLGGVWDLDAVTSALSRFADAALEAALAVAAEEERRAGRLGPGSAEHGPAPGFFCLALGKQGAFELNYSSDIDVSLFYHPELLEVVSGEPQVLALRLAKGLLDLLQGRTADGYVFRMDLRLRPDPSSTPVAVPVDAALDYYESVGQNWERAALIKGRAAAGDLPRAAAFLEALQPFVWRRNLDYRAISDIHAIKRQIHIHKVDERLTAPGADLKLGAGGIREIEFFAQTQQLIFGGRDPSLRSPRTQEALRALAAAGKTSLEAAEELCADYARLRGVEHRIQMVADEQTHVLPEARGERRRVAALCGHADLTAFDGFVSRILRRVNARYGALFSEDEPLSSRFGSLVFTGVEDDPETLRTLQRLGFSNPPQVAGLIRSWHHGRIAATRTERGRELFTRLAPRLLEAARATGAPDAAFNRFADFFTALSSGVQIQALFLAEPKLFSRVVDALAFAPRLAKTLARQPHALDTLLDSRSTAPLAGGGVEPLVAGEVAAAPDFEAAMNAARRIFREESFRIGMRIMAGAADAAEAGEGFTQLADACIRALAGAALLETERHAGPFPGAVAVVALGKAGSGEMTARSDLDLMTLYCRDGTEAASAIRGWSGETFYARFTQRLVSALSAPTSEGGLYDVDLQLRPSGTAGPVAVSLPAFEGYYAAEAETWEHLALTRGRVVFASRPEFGAEAGRAIEGALRRSRDPREAARDALAMRLLMRRERPAWGAWDLKLADGGLVDIEFAAQHLQIVHAAGGGPLRPNTGAALEALEAAGLAPAARLQALRGAWTLQQNLSQVLKIALEDGRSPQEEPPRFRKLLAAAVGARTFPELQRRLFQAQAEAARAFAEILEEEAAVSRGSSPLA